MEKSATKNANSVTDRGFDVNVRPFPSCIVDVYEVM